jgi:hypothetical protein
MSGDRTLDVRTERDPFEGSTTTKHFNVDNVAFFKAVDVNVTTIGKALVAAVGLTVFYLLNADKPLWGIIGGAVAAYLVWRWLYLLDGASIGALTDNTNLATKDLDAIESTFTEQSKELISIAGERPGVLRHFTYRHHFVPDNVVSIEHVRNDVGLFELFLAVNYFTGALVLPQAVTIATGNTSADPGAAILYLIAFPVTAILGVATVWVANNHRKNRLNARNSTGWARAKRFAAIAALALAANTVVVALISGSFSDGSVPILTSDVLPAVAQSFALGTGVLIVFLAEQTDEIALSLQSGEDKTFVVTSSDAQTVVRQFSSRDS